MRRTTTIVVDKAAGNRVTELAARIQSWHRDHRHLDRLAGLPKLAAVALAGGAGLLALGGSCQRGAPNWQVVQPESMSLAANASCM